MAEVSQPRPAVLKRESAPVLQFITQTGPVQSKNVQTQIRKHVMRDIGRSRRKETRHGKLKPLQFSLEIPDSIGDSRPVKEKGPIQDSDSLLKPVNTTPPLRITHVAEHEPTFPQNNHVDSAAFTEPQYASLEKSQVLLHGTAVAEPPIDRLWTGRMDPFIKYPIAMNFRMLQLMDHVFDDRYGNTPPFRDAWLPVGMMDPAAFHQVLSNAAMNLASLRASGNVPETLESLRHHARAVQLVNTRISNRSFATTDGLIGAVIGFACYSHAIGDYAGWHMHMDGIKEMLRLRGGLETLDSNRLVRMVLTWVDIGGAATEDVPPYFPFPPGVAQVPLISGILQSPHFRQIKDTWLYAFPEQPEIMNIMDDLLVFSDHLAKEVIRTNGKVYRDGVFAAMEILPLLHRLLSLSGAAVNITERESIVLQACRLASILYLAEIRRLFGVMGIVSEFQTEKLRNILESSADDWNDFGLLKMWCLAMGAMESSGSLRNWYIIVLVKEGEKLGIRGWDEIERQLRGVLWYEHVHTPIFRGLYDGSGNCFRRDNHLLGGSRFGGYRPIL